MTHQYPHPTGAEPHACHYPPSPGSHPCMGGLHQNVTCSILCKNTKSSWVKLSMHNTTRKTANCRGVHHHMITQNKTQINRAESSHQNSHLHSQKTTQSHISILIHIKPHKITAQKTSKSWVTGTPSKAAPFPQTPKQSPLSSPHHPTVDYSKKIVSSWGIQIQDFCWLILLCPFRWIKPTFQYHNIWKELKTSQHFTFSI